MSANRRASILPQYESSSDGEVAQPVPGAEILVPETQPLTSAGIDDEAGYVAPADTTSGDELITTTRIELSLTATPTSSAGGRPGTPTPVIGFTHGRDETPSAGVTHAERTAHINANNNKAMEQAAENDPMLTDIATQQGAHVLAADADVTIPDAQSNDTTIRPIMAGAVELAPRSRLIRHGGPVRRAANTSLTSLSALRAPVFGGGVGRASLGGRPSTVTANRTAAALASTSSSINSSRSPSPPIVMKLEPHDDFLQRIQQASQSRMSRVGAPSPAPSSRAARAGTSLEHAIDVDAPPSRQQEEAPFEPRNHQHGAGPEDAMDTADPFLAPHGAQPIRSPSPDVELPEFRTSGVTFQEPFISDRERARLAEKSPALAHSTIRFESFGGPMQADGIPQRHFLRGLTPEQIAHYDSKPGHKGVFFFWAVNGVAATMLATNELLGTGEYSCDRLFPYDNRLFFASLYTPKNVPGRRVRPCSAVFWGMSDGQRDVFKANTIVNVGSVQGLVYPWEGIEPTFVKCVKELRTESAKVVLALFQDLAESDAAVKAVVARQAANDNLDAGALLELVLNRFSVKMMRAKQPRTQKDIVQFTAYADIHDFFDDKQYADIMYALSALNFAHLDLGQSEPSTWECRIYLSRTHPTGKCLAVLLAAWIDYNQPNGQTTGSAGRGRGGAPASFNSVGH